MGDCIKKKQLRADIDAHKYKILIVTK